jgi:hypothetical protein
MATLSRSARQGPRSPFPRPQPTGRNTADLASRHPYYSGVYAFTLRKDQNHPRARPV